MASGAMHVGVSVVALFKLRKHVCTCMHLVVVRICDYTQVHAYVIVSSCWTTVM